MAEERSGKLEWYIAHTYAGYENKVKLSIEQTIENRNLGDLIKEVRVPTKIVTEIKDGKDGNPPKEVKKEKKLFPGYVILHMILTDDTWYIVRNTRGVTGFVGPDSKAVPIPEEQIEAISREEEEVVIQYKEGDTVVVTNDPYKDMIGKILSVNEKKRVVTIGLDLFGRETPVEISFVDIKKI